MQLANKVVVITGASSGIGKALAETAYEQEAKIAVCARNQDKLSALFTGFDDARLLVQAADVSKEEDCRRFVEAVAGRWGRIDVLICNAGVSMRALFEYADLNVLRELMDINFWGAVYCAKYALPYIIDQKGVIAGISSIAGYRGLPGRTGYSASKFALQGFLESLRTELTETGADVIWVSPGFTASNIRNTARSADGSPQSETPLEESKLMSAEQCAREIIGAVTARRRNLVLTGQGRLVVWLNKLFPGFADKMVYRHFLREQDSPLQNYRRPNP